MKDSLLLRILVRLSAPSLLVLAAPTAFAQDFERVMPKQPLQPGAPVIMPPADPNAPSLDQTVLLPELKGLVFVPALETVMTAGVPADAIYGGVAARDLPLLAAPEFTEQVRSYVGRPLTRADLDAIGRITRERYRSQERPFIEVSVPEQNVQSGVVQIVVTEYSVGEITTAGNQHFTDKQIRNLADLRSGDVLTLPAINEALRDYNRNPFASVTAVMKPGQAVGLSDIELQVKDRFPLRVYGGYDNQGVRTLDRDEWYAGFNWGNAFGVGQILSYQYTRAFNGNYDSHSLSDVIPINGHSRLWLFGGYSTQTPALGPFFNSEGHSSQVSARYMRDLEGPSGMLQHVQAGIDFKRTDNNLEFSRFRILDTAVEIVQFPALYSATFSDKGGETVFENTIVYSPGDMTSHNSDEDLQLLVPNADATYVYDRVSVTRTTWIAQDTAWVMRAMGQLASGNLPFSEQVGAGGLGSVRGYDINTAMGSNGVVLSTELRLPPFSLAGWFNGGKANEDRAQFSIFADYAHVSQPDDFPDLTNNADLASVGVSLHYNIVPNLDLQLDVGTQLIRAPLARERETQVAIVATVGF